MDVFYAYTYGSASWLTTQAVPLLLSPKLIVALLSNEAHAATEVEIYLSRALALSLIALAVLLVLLTGSIPLTNDLATTPISTSDPTTSAPEDSAKAPYAVPTILVSTGLHASSAFYTYARYSYTRQSGYALAALIWTTFASLGLWCLLFGTEKGRISKRTGADKRTSGWPFKNTEADKRKVFRKNL